MTTSRKYFRYILRIHRPWTARPRFHRGIQQLLMDMGTTYGWEFRSCSGTIIPFCPLQNLKVSDHFTFAEDVLLWRLTPTEREPSLQNGPIQGTSYTKRYRKKVLNSFFFSQCIFGLLLSRHKKSDKKFHYKHWPKDYLMTCSFY